MLMKKKIPTFKNDRAAAAFVDKADLTRFDLFRSEIDQLRDRAEGQINQPMTVRRVNAGSRKEHARTLIDKGQARQYLADLRSVAPSTPL